MKTLAVFDFDATLVAGDSLWLFTSAVRGRVWAALAFLAAFVLAPFTGLFWQDPRSGIKALWLLFTLRGVSELRCGRSAQKMKQRVRWLVPQVDALHKHKADGADILIATGALDVYIHILLQSLTVTAVLATPMERRTDNRLTGRMLHNATREEKARQVAAYIEQHGPYERIVGYGNLPNDRPMLALCHEQYVI